MNAAIKRISGQHKNTFSMLFSKAEGASILLLAAPLTGTALVNMGMSITDTVMMGWMGSIPLAAGAVVSDLYSIVFYFMSGILATVAAVLAQALGRDDNDGIMNAMRNGFQAALILAIPAFVIVWNMDLVLMAFGIEGQVGSLGNEYAKQMAFATVAMLGVAVWRNVFSAFGKPRIFLIMVLMALPLNAMLNYVLMFGKFGMPEMGLAGAGFSSALVAFAMMAGFTIYAGRDAVIKKHLLYGQLLRIEREGLAEIFRVGVPSGLATLGNVGIYLISTPIISLFGAEALAAHAIALRLAGVFYAIPVGLSQAATVRIGYTVGRGDHVATGYVKRTAIAMATVAGVICLGVLVMASDALPKLFLIGETGGATAIASTLIIFLGVLNFAECPNVVAGGVLRGFKDTRIPMMLTLAGYWGLGAPVMALMAETAGYGAQGVWFGLVIGVYATATLMLGRLFTPSFIKRRFIPNEAVVAAE